MTYRVEGVPQALRALQELPAGVRNRHARIALSAGGGVFKREAETRAPVGENRLLKRSLAVKVARKKEWFSVIGIKRGIKLARKRWFQGGRRRVLGVRASKVLASHPGGREQFINPARYLHLVEKGTRSHVVSTRKQTLAGRVRGRLRLFGKSVRVRAKSSGFMAIAAHAGQATAITRIERKIREGIEEERRKVATA